jgi:EAL domain-containing protein (putative c-di-GMP-specific phosphodiesterase class I)
MARKLGQSQEAGRHIRSLVADAIPRAPADAVIFVNIDPHDLDDDDLMSGRDSLTKYAQRVILEITERDSLKSLSDLDCKVKLLRDLGYRIALDDLGAGYAGLTSLALVLPDVVKFDMDLVRDIDRSPTKQALIRSMAATCRELGIQTLAEGIESPRERDVVIGLGCGLLQGFMFGKASREFVRVNG